MTDDVLSDDDLVVAPAVEIVTAPEFSADIERMLPYVEALVRGFAANRIRMTDTQERADLVTLRGHAQQIRDLLGLVTATIERVFATYAAEAEATTIPLGEGRRPVLFEKHRTEYVTRADELRRALLALHHTSGAPTEHEIEKAVKVVVTHVPDHRALNALVTKYGGEVKAAIEANRTRPEADPAKGRVRFPELDR